MKKKVLALVVLAAMLISILPMAAFAAADYTVSKVYVDTDTATADGEDTLEFDVNLIDAAGDAQEGTFYIATSRPSVDKIYVGDSEDPISYDENGVAAITAA